MTTNSPHLDQPVAAPTFLAGDTAASVEPVSTELAAIERGIARAEWRAAAKERREADQLREALINQYRPLLLAAIAAPSSRRPELRDDFYQAAVEGLLLGELSWRVRGHVGTAAGFGAYVKAYVGYQVLKAGRLADPIPLSERASALAGAIAEVEDFYRELGLPTPTDALIADRLDGVSTDLVHAVRNRPRAVTLDIEVHGSRAVAISRGGDPEEAAMLAEIEREVPRAIRRLPEREQDLVEALVAHDGVLTLAAGAVGMKTRNAYNLRQYTRFQLAGEPTLEGYCEAA